MRVASASKSYPTNTRNLHPGASKFITPCCVRHRLQALTTTKCGSPATSTCRQRTIVGLIALLNHPIITHARLVNAQTLSICSTLSAFQHLLSLSLTIDLRHISDDPSRSTTSFNDFSAWLSIRFFFSLLDFPFFVSIETPLPCYHGQFYSFDPRRCHS